MKSLQLQTWDAPLFFNWIVDARNLLSTLLFAELTLLRCMLYVRVYHACSVSRFATGKAVDLAKSGIRLYARHASRKSASRKAVDAMAQQTYLGSVGYSRSPNTRDVLV